MTNLNIALSTWLKKLGVDINSDGAKKLLGNSALTSIEVPAEILTSLDKEFFTLESALNHPDILSKARAEALNGVDKHLEQIWEGSGLDADAISKIKGEKTTAKISKTIDLIKSKKDEAFNATGKEKQELVKEINALQDKLVNETKRFESLITEEKNGRKQDKINGELDNFYNSFDYVTPLDKSTNTLTAKTIINKLAQEKGVVFELGENGLTLKTTAGTDYMTDNQKLSPKDFIQKSLIEAKFIKVNNGGGEGQKQTQTIHQSVAMDKNNPMNGYLTSLKKETTGFVPATT